jgi:hypothetical protein
MHKHGHEGPHYFIYLCIRTDLSHLQILYILFIYEPSLGTGGIVVIVAPLCAIVIIVIVIGIVCKRKRRNQKDESIDGMSIILTLSVLFFF